LISSEFSGVGLELVPDFLQIKAAGKNYFLLLVDAE
jgi:hypothetical protein